MSSASDDNAAEEAPAGSKKKRTQVLMRSAGLGLVGVMLIGGAIYHFQSLGKVKTELAAVRKEVGREAKRLAKAEAQVAELTPQIASLKELVATRTKELAAETLAKETQQTLVKEAQQALEDYKLAASKPANVSATRSTTQALPATEKTGKEGLPASPPADKKGKFVKLDCQIAGKSPEDQMETLKLCTQAMDRGSRR